VQRRKYSTEFKREAVELTRDLGVTITQVARELGINPNMLGRWRKEFEEQGQSAFKGHGHTHDEEVTALRRELARIKRERDFLKDAAAFFASELR